MYIFKQIKLLAAIQILITAAVELVINDNLFKDSSIGLITFVQANSNYKICRYIIYMHRIYFYYIHLCKLYIIIFNNCSQISSSVDMKSSLIDGLID